MIVERSGPVQPVGSVRKGLRFSPPLPTTPNNVTLTLLIGTTAGISIDSVLQRVLSARNGADVDERIGV